MEEDQKTPHTAEVEEQISDGVQPEKKPAHGRNWITDMYDKANLSVDTLNYIAVGLLIFIFAVLIFATKK